MKVFSLENFGTLSILLLTYGCSINSNVDSTNSSSLAADYEPVICDSARPYIGKPLYPGVDLAWDVKASISGSFDESTALRFSDAVDKAMLATAASSMTVSVAVPGIGIWSTDRTSDGIPLNTDMHYWASAGKSLTALTVLKLSEESKLSLIDPVSKYIEGVPNGDAITIESLLNHTNGLFSFNEDLVVRESNLQLNHDELLALLNRHGAMFCPGEYWRYTNSGYELLGYVLEAIENRPFDEVIAETVVEPLHLQNMRILSRNETPQDVAPLISSDPMVETMRLGSAGAAGPMVASSDAVVRLWHAVLGNQILKRETLEKMSSDLYPMFGSPPYYGLGVMVYVVPQPDGETKLWVGHSGGAPGVKAMFAYSPSDNAFVAVALSGDGSAEATANLLLQALTN